MGWRERLEGGGFLKVVEVLPPKGIDEKGFGERLIPLRGRVDAIYIPSLQGGVMRMSSWAACKYLQEKGYDTIFEVSCAHQNRVALQAELLGAYLLGLENVMAVPGDDPKLGDHPEAKGVFDIDLIELLEGIRRLQKGYDMSGGDLEGSPRFCVGAKLDASARGHVLDLEMKEMEKKIRLGVEFFITTSVYDLGQFETFMQKAQTFGVPVIAGLMVLKSAGMARYINKHVEGVFIPDEIIMRLMKAPDKIAASIEIAAEMIRGIKDLCQGVNIISIGWEDKIPAILEEAEG
ncbi:MAG: 5,10-methylenetetrahydrofolate reductase [Deltaproteobacteria bacterium]|nr:MAG: 5,10-methylenetetrahydrofolate reductase [Deltaproteobacteria bacterium]